MLSPVEGALTQEAIDVAAILNALRALTAPLNLSRAQLPPAAARDPHSAHPTLASTVCARPPTPLMTSNPRSRALIEEADRLVAEHVVSHEPEDEGAVYPEIAKYLRDPAARRVRILIEAGMR